MIYLIRKVASNYIHTMICLFLSVSLISCTTLDKNNIAPGFKNAFVSINRAIFGYSSDFIDQNLVDGIPYASMKVTIGKGPSGLMILERLSEGALIWVSADNILFVVKEGRIVRTSGLDNNLIAYESPFYTFKQILESNFNLDSFNVYYSYDKPQLYGLKTEASIKVLGKQNIDILGRDKETILFEETVENKYLGWKVKNRFWVDPRTGFVWKSIQNISPKLPQIEMTITKKPTI